ncbi:hypothetical protein C0J52_27959 [Blattella germanica]|nr:hypothetical protein C0J52_27959 [Blattella germanica]
MYLEETGEWRRLHNTELKDLYGKPDIIRTIKSQTRITLTLREEKRLRVFENKVLRKTFEPKRDEEIGEDYITLS